MSITAIKRLPDLAGFRLVTVFSAHDNPQCEPLSFKDFGERVYSLKKGKLQEISLKVAPSRLESYTRRIRIQSETAIRTPEGELFLLSDFDDEDGKELSLLGENTKPQDLKWPGPPF